MAEAREYLATFPTPCVFHTEEDMVCGQPAVAVYVTADFQHEARYVCERHARGAERDGDGPVFWPNLHVPSGPLDLLVAYEAASRPHQPTKG